METDGTISGHSPSGSETDLAQLENGLDTLVGPRGTRLCGRQAQCVAAARLLLRWLLQTDQEAGSAA